MQWATSFKAMTKAASAATTTTKAVDCSNAESVKEMQLRQNTSPTQKTANSPKPGTPPNWAATPSPPPSSAISWAASLARRKPSRAPMAAKSGSIAWIASSTNSAPRRKPPTQACPPLNGRPMVQATCTESYSMAAASSTSNVTSCTARSNASSAPQTPSAATTRSRA
ncbi:hypothetical protein SDC9_169858 [bioreactor metagenome]|uniref:Uncharacterized protein n=1 Tax=bioreactor metagenome TaxID=1076179 RepID=A0A645G752_9ZZZZ